jgi:hypothetical protein
VPEAASALTRLDRLLHHDRLDDWLLTRQLRWVLGQAHQRGPTLRMLHHNLKFVKQE